MNEWDDYAANWDSDPGARGYARAAFLSLQPVLADSGVSLAGARVCDFGAGTGLLAEQLVAAGAAVDAVDTSPG
ncbi:MAG: SAM-dependent methyltransferase, partial [Actinobacteria bacterium]|nr:SAM-dependent methyltransferase [Actinomycetota bacterium]